MFGGQGGEEPAKAMRLKATLVSTVFAKQGGVSWAKATERSHKRRPRAEPGLGSGDHLTKSSVSGEVLDRMGGQGVGADANSTLKCWCEGPQPCICMRQLSLLLSPHLFSTQVSSPPISHQHPSWDGEQNSEVGPGLSFLFLVPTSYNQSRQAL